MTSLNPNANALLAAYNSVMGQDLAMNLKCKTYGTI